MKKSIFQSICLTVFSVFAVLLVLITGVLYDYFNTVQQRGMRMQTDLIAKAVEVEGTAFFDKLEEENYRITYIEPDGSVIYDSQEGGRILENHLDRQEVKEAIENGYGESYRYSDTLLEKRHYSAKKLSDGSIIRLSGGHYTLLSLILTMLPFVLAIGIAAFLVSLVLASRLSNSIVRPLNELNLDQPMENNAYEELHPLLARIDSQQEQLKQTEQIRREFTSNVSHELKTPLHSISGYAELLKNGIVKEEDIGHFAEQIYSEAQRLTFLVDDIIKLTHLDEGGENLPWEEADLYKLAEKTVNYLDVEAREAKVVLTLTGEHIRLWCCPQLIEGILFNLCDNAIKYNRENGRVDISISEEPGSGDLRSRNLRSADSGSADPGSGDLRSRNLRSADSGSADPGSGGLRSVDPGSADPGNRNPESVDPGMAVLTVSDTGIGIPREYQERIFERFYRVDKSRSKAVGGTGLGLSIVKHAAMLHHAEIMVDSTPGLGTVISICFPREDRSLDKMKGVGNESGNEMV